MHCVVIRSYKKLTNSHHLPSISISITLANSNTTFPRSPFLKVLKSQTRLSRYTFSIFLLGFHTKYLISSHFYPYSQSQNYLITIVIIQTCVKRELNVNWGARDV